MTISTSSESTHNPQLTVGQGLLPVKASNWFAGFGNMLTKELGEWFHTRRWQWQILIWLTIINGFIALPIFILPWIASIFPTVKPVIEQITNGTMGMLSPELKVPFWYFSLVVMNGALGVIILAQDEIIQEKQSGTAAWILSKPAARQSFIMTKLLSNITGALVFIVGLPGLIALGESYLATHDMLPLLPFLSGVMMAVLALVFYISLVIMLGVLFESRGPVLAIAIGIIFGGNLFGTLFPQMAYVLPLKMDAVALQLMMGEPLPTMFISEVIATVVLSVVFILVALWRFQRKEF